MNLALWISIAAGIVWLLAHSLHAEIARRSRARWRGVEAARVPVHRAPMGAFRDEGTVAIPFDGVPREVRRASFVASLAAVAYLPQPFVLGAVVGVCTADTPLGGYWFPAFAVALLSSYASVLQLDAARLALLRRSPDAERHARAIVFLLVAPHALVVAGSLALPLLVGPQPAAAWLALAACDLLSLGLVASGLYVRRAALRYRDALDRDLV
jgi:hypothetical protein